MEECGIPIDEPLDADLGWSFIPVGYCGVFYRELPNPENPDQTLTQFLMQPHPAGIAGNGSPAAHLKERLAHFMCTHCPAEKYARRGTWDQVMRCAELLHDYMAIAQCFLAIDSDIDPLQQRLESSEDNLDEWAHQQIWYYAHAFQVLYEVLLARWDAIQEAFHKLSRKDPRFKLNHNDIYSFYTTLIEEVANSEIQACFAPLFEDKPKPLGQLATLKRREMGDTISVKTREKREITSDEKMQIKELSQKYIDKSCGLFQDLQVAWKLLSQQDSWLQNQLVAYEKLFCKIWKQEQSATHKPSLKKHRPSETWAKGKRRLNQRGKYDKKGS